jgi:hypothetical protein
MGEGFMTILAVNVEEGKEGTGDGSVGAGEASSNESNSLAYVISPSAVLACK